MSNISAHESSPTTELQSHHQSMWTTERCQFFVELAPHAHYCADRGNDLLRSSAFDAFRENAVEENLKKSKRRLSILRLSH
jgi:hypothetical protein